MARNYPRFLYSNPQNTKSEGPFIVHTIFPRSIFKVHRKNPPQVAFVHGLHGKFLSVELLDIQECTDDEKRQLTGEAYQWFNSQPEASIYII
jgi:hypothetical protein